MLPISGVSLERLRGDFYGGITTAVVALPLALAFGVASGVGPLAGMYGAILVGFFAAIFGGTPAQVSGPTGPMTIVMAIIVLKFANNPALAFTVVMLGGVLQILFGALKFGRFINLVPYPVISGFMSGIGSIIIILQLAPLIGHEAVGGPLQSLIALPGMFSNPDSNTLILGLITLGIVYFIPKKISRYIPGALLALIVGTVLSLLVFKNVSVLGEIPEGLPTPHLPTFSMASFVLIIQYALILAFLGSIDSLLTSLIADSITRTHHDSDKELIGQGIGNVVAGLFGAIPGAGATMRTVVNIRAGGHSPVSGVLHSVVLLLLVLGLGPLAENIPHVVLAGILIKVGVDIIDWNYLKRLRHVPRSGVFIMLTTFGLTVLVDLITAVAVGMIMASLIFVKRMADTQAKSMKLIGADGEWHELNTEESAILERSGGKILLFHIEGPMSFGSAKNIVKLLSTDRDQDVLLLDFSDVTFIDSTAALAVEEIILNAHEDNDQVILCGLREPVEKVLKKIGILKLLPANQIIKTRVESLRFAEQLLNN